MRKWKLMGSLLAMSMLGTTILPAATAAAEAVPVNQEPMVLRYDEPANSTRTKVRGASQWEAASLPIGNGVLGANVFGEVGEEILTVNEETLWSGGRGSVDNYDGGNPDPTAARTAYDTISAQLMNDQTWVNMESLRGDPRNESGYDAGYQPLGQLVFHFGHRNQSNYQRTLSLDESLATVQYAADGVTYSREYFASNPDNVIAAHFTADQSGKLNFTTDFRTGFTTGVTATASVQNGIGYITASGSIQDELVSLPGGARTVKGNGLLHSTQIAVVTDGTVEATGQQLKISNADTVTVYLTAATDYANVFRSGETEYYYRTGETAEALDARVSETLSAAVRKGYDGVRASHISDYTALYDRVKLNVGQTASRHTTDDLLHAYQNGTLEAGEQRYLEVLLFQYGRYLLISGSRYNPDGVTSQLPTTLQGIWNDISGTDWNSDIHTNINLQMNYWLSGPCNLTECAQPLVDYVAKLKEPGGRTVEIYTGAKNGIMAHTQNTPFGYTAPGWEIGTWGWSPAAATWLMQNCYDYYQYSGDTETLRTTIYPMLQDQVLMYEQLLQLKDGRKVMPIALSPEIGPVTCGNTFEQSLIWQLYADTIEAAEKLGEPVPQAWRDTMEQLRPIEIGQSGQIIEWYQESTINSVEDTSGHRHLSNLLGLFPGDAIDTPEKLAAARVSLENKNFGRVGTEGNNPDGGWTYGQMIPSWARVGDGDNAYFCVSQMIKNRLFENLWDYHNAAIFQIDGNYGYSAGVAEMLVQSNLGAIKLLPAISQEWKDGAVSGLLTEGGVEVSMSWADSQITTATLTARQDGTVRILNPFGDRALKVDGHVVSCDEKGVASIEAAAGSTYVLTAKQPPKPLNVRASRAESGAVTLTWDAQSDVTYTVTRRELP